MQPTGNTTHGTALGEARDLRYLQERARGGVGFMGLHGSDGIFGYAVGPGGHAATPDWDGKAPSPVTAEGVAFYDNRVIPYLRKRAEVIHAEGAACYAQMYHLRAAPHAQRLYPALAPSAVADPNDLLMPHPLTSGQIDELVFAFAQGVRRIKEAGLDAAEIHGAHGSRSRVLLSYFNRRSDQWGGSRENRVRFVLTVIAEARKLVGPDFPIGIRVGLDGDGHHNGLTIDELAEIGALLSDHVAYISVRRRQLLRDSVAGSRTPASVRTPGVPRELRLQCADGRRDETEGRMPRHRDRSDRGPVHCRGNSRRWRGRGA